MTALFTIDAHLPFLETLARQIWQENEGDGFRLAQTLVLLPTRRACRHLGTRFAKQAQGKATLLPRLQPLGDSDVDELIFADAHFPDIPPAIEPLRRLMLLTQLVQKRDASLSWEQAALAARELARFLDQVHIEGCDMAELPSLVQASELATHWQETLAFLAIVTEFWPTMLKELGCIDPADRRNRVLEAQAAEWQKNPPPHPIIAAGSTGSVPATRRLLTTISQLPQGAVILPALDRTMENEAWELVSETHPQHSMKKLLETIGIERQKVRHWGDERTPRPRCHLLNLSMRPAEVTDQWHNKRGTLPSASTDGMSRITLDHPQEEAQVIGLRLRALLETPDQTAALVTADRTLALRVTSLLERWGILIDDSGGLALSSLPCGSFLSLLYHAAHPRAGHIDALALLKHPLAACGQATVACRAEARATELTLRNGKDAAFDKLKDLLSPLREVWDQSLPLEERIALHIRIAESVAATDTQDGASRLWRGEYGAEIAKWLNDWLTGAQGFPGITANDYISLFDTLIKATPVSSGTPTHPRLSILGPLEARLISTDLVILGGMNEGVWPPDMGFDAWMSRPMRRNFGLPLPEYRIGLSAHDFAQLACSPNVMITRAIRSGGMPTTPSRFLLHLEAVLQASGLSDASHDALAPEQPWRLWAAALDQPAAIIPCERPQPCPPVALRPTTLSVTEIGTWQRNPYALYAKHILHLRKLEELDADPDASDRGIIFHAALEKFVQAYPREIPADGLNRLLDIGRTLFADEQDPRVQSFWWARFTQMAGWFIDTERERRKTGIMPLMVEAKGKLHLGAFTLTGRADRIDRLPSGDLCISDYKTGTLPTGKEITFGIEPQMPLLALMAQRGGFNDIKAAQVGSIAYWVLKGGRSGCEVKDKFTEKLPAWIVSAEKGLTDLIKAFEKASTPYEAVPKARFQPHYNDYAHLSRQQEWGRSGNEDDVL